MCHHSTRRTERVVQPDQAALRINVDTSLNQPSAAPSHHACADAPTDTTFQDLKFFTSGTIKSASLRVGVWASFPVCPLLAQAVSAAWLAAPGHPFSGRTCCSIAGSSDPCLRLRSRRLLSVHSPLQSPSLLAVRPRWRSPRRALLEPLLGSRRLRQRNRWTPSAFKPMTLHRRRPAPVFAQGKRQKKL